MKKIFLFASAMVFSMAVMAQAPAQLKADDVAKFNTQKHDFGKIKQSVPATTYFELTNTSNKPIIIESASASCGCTTPEYSKEPIAPNATTKIKVGYNAAAMGVFSKDVTVKIAGADPKILKITGEVLDANNWETYVKSEEYKKAEAAKNATSKKKTGKKK